MTPLLLQQLREARAKLDSAFKAHHTQWITNSYADLAKAVDALLAQSENVAPSPVFDVAEALRILDGLWNGELVNMRENYVLLRNMIQSTVGHPEEIEHDGKRWRPLQLEVKAHPDDLLLAPNGAVLLRETLDERFVNGMLAAGAVYYREVPKEPVIIEVTVRAVLGGFIVDETLDLRPHIGKEFKAVLTGEPYQEGERS